MADDGTEGEPRLGKTGRVVAIATLATGLVIGAALILDRGEAEQPVQLRQVVGPGAAAGFNVLLVTVDTTRPDRLGCYGYGPAQTPTIDSLAACGIRFDDAVASSPLTLPSHATMLTGLYPVNHGARDNGATHLPTDRVTLAEVLRARGYDTAAFVSCFVLEQRFGLAQGFDVYDFQVTPEGHRPDLADVSERGADVVTDAAVEWLDRRQAATAAVPFFLWVHYFDPHHPYESPLGKTAQFAGRPYDAEIAFVDTQLRRLLDALGGHGLRERTLIALVTDHGEALSEHREQTHGYYIYDCTIRVGFVLSCPALFDRAYCVNDRVVGLVDLKPTIEDLLGIGSTGSGDGQSLLADIDPDRAIYVETRMPLTMAGWSPLYALRRHRDKYILAPEPEYYDLRADSSESRNLYSMRPPGLEALEHQLAQLRSRWGPDGDAGAAARVMSPEETQRLQSLGYVHSQAGPPSGPRPDPKAMMPVRQKVRQAIELFHQGRLEKALGFALAALEECDSYPVGERTLASIYFELGRMNEAVGVLRHSARRNPEFATYVSLARIYLHLHRYRQAEQAIASAEEIQPDDGRVFMLRGDLLGIQNRFTEAIAQYERAIQIDEHRAGIPARQKIERVRSMMEQDTGP